MTTAKICGLSTPETLDAAIRHGASHIGFVFFPPSPRHVVFDRAASLAARVPDHVVAVGVFVDPDDALVEQGVRAGKLGAIQLHKTAPERVAHLRKLSRVETWATVAVKTRADLAASTTYVGAADRVLFDAKTPEDAALPGGLGVRFDWSLLDGWNHALPWALSGGLDAGNVGEAIGRTGATLVDVSSGVEDEPGTKNVDKIAAFLQAVARK
jgi:phosphoribosylanthranilate isomerase